MITTYDILSPEEMSQPGRHTLVNFSVFAVVMLQILIFWHETLCRVPEELKYFVFSVVLRFLRLSFVLSGYFSRDRLMLIRV